MSEAQPHPNDDLLSQQHGPVRWLTLNRPKQYNALSLALINELDKALSEADADPDTHAIVLRGSGRGFCAGHDLKEVKALVSAGDEAALRGLLEACNAMMIRLMSGATPVIAAVHGLATAAGCQLVAACDLAIASDDAGFATPGVNIGLYCSTPSVPLTRNLPRKHANRMLLTGDAISAQDAERMALINEAVPAAELEARCESLANRIASRSSASIRYGKPLYQAQIDERLGDAFAIATDVMLRNLFDADAEEGIDAVLGKRQPSWPSDLPGERSGD